LLAKVGSKIGCVPINELVTVKGLDVMEAIIIPTTATAHIPSPIPSAAEVLSLDYTIQLSEHPSLLFLLLSSHC
jgi:hypothetical protein